MAVGMGGSSPPWVLLCKDMVVKKARGHPSASSILVRIPLGWEATELQLFPASHLA